MGRLAQVVRARLLLRRIRKFGRRRVDEVPRSPPETPASAWWRGATTQRALSSGLGVACGAALVVLLLVTLVSEAGVSPTWAGGACALLAPPLCLGLAFSARVRCAALLVLPQLSSSKGRHALVAVALALALTGPFANTVHNLEQTAHSLTCTLHLAGRGFGKLVDLVERPAETAKRAVEKALKAVEESVARIKGTLQGLQRVINAIEGVLKSSEEWLEHVLDVCNGEFGTPIERCYHTFEKSSRDCSDTLGATFSWLCSVVYATSLVCNSLSAVSLVCVAADPVGHAVSSSIATVRDKFEAEMAALFFVRVEYSQEMDADLTADNRTLAQALGEMRAELRGTTRPLLALYHLAGGVLGLAWILVLYKAHRYHHKFRTDDRFDNRYVTSEVRQIDVARLRQGKEPILPLRPFERSRYCSPGQLRLLGPERRRLARSLIFLLVATANVVYALWCDWGLFWLLDLVRRSIHLPNKLPKPPTVELHVEGQGLVPDMFRNLTQALSPDDGASFFDNLDPNSCLPNPRAPDLRLYVRIGVLLFLAWVCAFVEPLVLRLRPMVLGLYYPERARARAQWLCAHVLRERALPLSATPLSSDFVENLKDRWWVARLILGRETRASCVACASTEASLFECEAVGCDARYCDTCLANTATCLVCGQPPSQPDIPGLQLEMESSNEDEEEAVEQVGVETPLMPSTVRIKGDDDSEVVANFHVAQAEAFVDNFVAEIQRAAVQTAEQLGLQTNLPEF